MIPTGIAIKDGLLILAGNIFIVILIVRCIGAYAKREWGELVINFVGAVLIAGLVYFTDGSMQMLKNIWQTLVG